MCAGELEEQHKVVESPSMAGGVLARLVTDGSTVWSERWTPSGWTRHGAPDVAEVMSAPPASSRTMDRLGVPLSERRGEDPDWRETDPQLNPRACETG